MEEPTTPPSPPRKPYLIVYEDADAIRNEHDKKQWLAKLEHMFKNVTERERRLAKKGRDKNSDKQWERLSGALVRGVAYARERGWIAQSEQSKN